MNELSLVMIVRNEAARLARCLEKARLWADELVIVDTGSIDGTVEIAKGFTEWVYTFPWCGDFSAARNFALAKATRPWALVLDADEELAGDPAELRERLEKGGCDAYFLSLHNCHEAQGGYNRYWVLRLFRNIPEYRFQGRIHEQVMVKDPERVGVLENPVIRHHPRSSPGERQGKRVRNLRLLARSLEEDPDNPYLLYYAGVDWLGLGNFPQAMACLERAMVLLPREQTLFHTACLRSRIACLHAAGQGDRALCLCLEESRRYPDYSDLFYEGGLLLEERGDYAAAVRWFQAAVDTGPTPGMYVHTHGADSFLAHYHLGYCQERLGRLAAAKAAYRQALAANGEYIYPLYSLFALELAEKGGEGAYNSLAEEGFLASEAGRTALGELFWQAGMPRLACRCLVESPEDHGEGVRLSPLGVRVCLYGGHPREALAQIEALRATGDALEPEVAVDEVAALLAMGDQRQAKAKALALWRRAEGRGRAWGLLNLIAASQGKTPAGWPEGHRVKEAVAVLLGIFRSCLHHLGDAGTCLPAASPYFRLAGAARDALVGLGREGALALAEFLRGESRRIGAGMAVVGEAAKEEGT